MTFVAALRCERIEAPCLFDGSVNGESFLAIRRRPAKDQRLILEDIPVSPGGPEYGDSDAGA